MRFGLPNIGHHCGYQGAVDWPSVANFFSLRSCHRSYRVYFKRRCKPSNCNDDGRVFNIPIRSWHTHDQYQLSHDADDDADQWSECRHNSASSCRYRHGHSVCFAGLVPDGTMMRPQRLLLLMVFCLFSRSASAQLTTVTAGSGINQTVTVTSANLFKLVFEAYDNWGMSQWYDLVNDPEPPLILPWPTA